MTINTINKNRNCDLKGSWKVPEKEKENDEGEGGLEIYAGNQDDNDILEMFHVPKKTNHLPQVAVFV